MLFPIDPAHADDLARPAGAPDTAPAFVPAGPPLPDGLRLPDAATDVVDDEAGGPDPKRQSEYAANVAKSVEKLQRFRSETRLDVTRADGRVGKGRLVDLLPEVGRSWLLELTWPGRAPAAFHLESRRALDLVLASDDLGVRTADGSLVWCDVIADGGAALEKARTSGQAYTPFCDDLVVLRGVVDGRKTSIEWTTDFLRDNVPGGDTLTQFVRDTFFAGEHAKSGELQAGGGGGGSAGGPRAARVDPAVAGARIVPQDFGLEVEGAEGGELEIGAWYPVARQPGVWASVVKPAVLDPALIASLEGRINPLDETEKEALIYSVAFDLDQFALDYVLGTEHPRVEWSERAETIRARYPDLPGPDGFADTAPLARVGQVDPEEVPFVAATFTGGFKRLHGAFGSGTLARVNLGSHYGFVEDGVVYGKLVPGLATIVGWADGSVTFEVWSEARDADAPRIRWARQNGVPLIETDPTTGEVGPNPLVLRWTGGNWASSPEARLRSLRASASVQERDGRRYLVYSWFSDHTPSAMAATLLAYGGQFGMLLDMNALEHTYCALYTPGDHGPVPHHLVTGMSVLDRADDAGHVLPRFLAFPDNRDFFTLSRKP